jgi:hypothetical protein
MTKEGNEGKEKNRQEIYKKKVNKMNRRHGGKDKRRNEEKQEQMQKY